MFFSNLNLLKSPELATPHESMNHVNLKSIVQPIFYKLKALALYECSLLVPRTSGISTPPTYSLN